jgi:hypothetical protein
MSASDAGVVEARRGQGGRPDFREGAAPDGGIISTPLPARLWPGPIVIAKPVDPTRGQVNEMSAAGPGPISRLKARRSARPHHRYKVTPKSCPTDVADDDQARLGDRADAGVRRRSRLHSPPPATQK